MPLEEAWRHVVIWMPSREQWQSPFEVIEVHQLWAAKRRGRVLYWQELTPPEGVSVEMARRLMDQPGE